MADHTSPSSAAYRTDAGSTSKWRHGGIAEGRPARWPDLVEATRFRMTGAVLAAAHLDSDPTNDRPTNLRALFQRCHMVHDRPHRLAQRSIT